MLIVEQPALYTSIQDQGRAGVAHLGISPGGANDRLAAWLGNHVLGNPDDAAVLELIEPPARLYLPSGHHVAFTGADADIRCHDKRLPLYAPCWLPAGSRVEIARPRFGSTVYLSVAGGFVTPALLGSRGADPRLGLRPLDRRAVLPTVAQRAPAEAGTVHIAPRYPDGLTLCDLYSPVLDVSPGPDFALLTADSRQHLGERTFTVSSQSSRMGIRLQGQPLAAETTQCLSAGVCMGAVQLPPQGLPILLAAEHQTTGGYPLVLQVCPHHLSRMAQLRIGERIRFNLLAEDQARRTQQRLRTWLRHCLKEMASDDHPY